MNPWHVYLAMLAMLSASIAQAEDFKTINGKEYKNATVSRVEPDGIVIKYKSGISKIFFVELPKEVQQRFGYDAAKIAERQKQQESAERERQENVEVDLKRALEQFQAAEQRVAQSYQSATKGTLSGQVFISTEGGENRKLGSVQVSLFAREAMDTLLAALRKYADIKIQVLSPSVDAARVTMEQEKEAAHEAAYDEYQRILRDRDFYYSGAFFFGYLFNPIKAAETDADGKFTIEVPKAGSFVIAAKAERYVGKTYVMEIGIDIREHYYWLQPVSLEGQQQRTQNLSNNNLTSTTGSSSLIHTKD